MKQLQDLTENFETSRPIFRLTNNNGDSTIQANMRNPVHKYEPSFEPGNPLSELVCEHYEEYFRVDMGRFEVDKYRIAQQAMQKIRSSIPTFLEKNLEMRNPRQSKIYRWYYRNLPHNVDFNDTLIMVYKYMRTFCGYDMRSVNAEHTNNTVALLEAIMEKYNEE